MTIGTGLLRQQVSSVARSCLAVDRSILFRPSARNTPRYSNSQNNLVSTRRTYKSFRDRRRESQPQHNSMSSDVWGGVVVTVLALGGGAVSAIIMAQP